jgi:hypothetical protein
MGTMQRRVFVAPAVLLTKLQTDRANAFSASDAYSTLPDLMGPAVCYAEVKEAHLSRHEG